MSDTLDAIADELEQRVQELSDALRASTKQHQDTPRPSPEPSPTKHHV